MTPRDSTGSATNGVARPVVPSLPALETTGRPSERPFVVVKDGENVERIFGSVAALRVGRPPAPSALSDLAGRGAFVTGLSEEDFTVGIRREPAIGRGRQVCIRLGSSRGPVLGLLGVEDQLRGPVRLFGFGQGPCTVLCDMLMDAGLGLYERVFGGCGGPVAKALGFLQGCVMPVVTSA